MIIRNILHHSRTDGKYGARYVLPRHREARRTAAIPRTFQKPYGIAASPLLGGASQWRREPGQAVPIY